jgi:UDP-glucuronate 4-epimerase
VKVLVTGAAGFIASHVTERLLDRGEEVLGFDNFDPFYPRETKEGNLRAFASRPGFAFRAGDLRNKADVEEAFAAFQPEAVIHLAAKAGVRPSIENPEAYVETNVTGTLHLLRACEKRNLRHFVFASSSSVYGDANKVPFSESDRTDSPESPYAATKKAGESLCFTYHQLYKLPVTCLRFFTVYGPRQRPDLAIHKFVRLISQGETIPFFGDGTTSRDYTYVEDTADGILRALDHPSGYEIYNLGRSNPVSLNDMVKTIEEAMGVKATLKRLPDQAGDVRTTYADVSKAQERLGYAPKIEFEEGIRRFVAWHRANRSA